MSKRSETRQKFIDALIKTGKSEVTKADIVKICTKNKITVPQWFLNEESNKIKRGVYRVPSNKVETAPAIENAAQVIPIDNKIVIHSDNRIHNVKTDLESVNLVPTVYKNYVPFGNFEDILSIVKSERFFPVFITGHSGNGKTMSIEQACAKAKRKFVVVSMTPETDESDLLGNYVLIDGNMEWRDGPVTTAARQGAVLCIDEIDYGAQNLSSLQRVLEGKPFMLKKKGELVVPANGFTVFATANTKGKGSDDGRYMFTNVLNEAFLERFPNTMEQDFPPMKIEKKIIEKELDSVGRADADFADKLVNWADVIRKTFFDGGVDEVISTRRLVHIVKSYGIYGDKKKAIELCLNRFDDDTKASFVDLYSKVDANVNGETEIKIDEVKADDVEIPF
jgi:hypothetical protein